jgi:hypothetical protein
LQHEKAESGYYGSVLGRRGFQNSQVVEKEMGLLS